MASVTCNFFKKVFSLRNKWFCQDDGVSIQSNRSSNIFMEIQKILIWNDPFFSCCCIVAVNIVFWSIIYLNLRFYDIIFTTLLIITCLQLWMEYFSKYLHKTKSDSQNVISDSPRTSNGRTSSPIDLNIFFTNTRIMLKETYAKAKFFRRSHPGMFCLVTCMGFLLLGVLGRSLSDVLVLYILLMLLMTVPGALIHFLPQDVIECLRNFFYSSREASCSDTDDEVEPYLPHTSEEALELLKLAGDLHPPDGENDESNDYLLERLSERTSDTAESGCSKMSIFPESSVMPSPENSMDLWEFDLPLEEKAEFIETDSYGINFQSRYFDGDSSEEEFIKGLHIKDETTKKHTKNKTQESKSVLDTENLISVVKNFLEAELTKKTTSSDKESSSDTDSFELISEEDIGRTKTWTELRDAMIEIAKLTIPTIKSKKHVWWSHARDEAIATRKKAWLKWNTNEEQRNQLARIPKSEKNYSTDITQRKKESQQKRNNSTGRRL